MWWSNVGAFPAVVTARAPTGARADGEIDPRARGAKINCFRERLRGRSCNNSFAGLRLERPAPRVRVNH